MNWHHYPPSRPRSADGIRAQSRSGAFADSWWARRWIAHLEATGIGARLGRGRNYARRGQVLSLSIEEGEVTARVQGSRSRPYRVSITIDTLSAGQQKTLREAITSQALYSAELLAGHMPEDIEDLFAAVGLSLFPQHMETDCSCPDWSNPCKHIAAVFYLVGEELDRDPFLLLKMRGVDLADLPDGPPAPEAAAEPLPPSPDEFWRGGEVPRYEPEAPTTSSTPAVLPRLLGKFPLWRGRTPLLKALDPAYRKARKLGGEMASPG
ncbi:MAG: SWIM zinc finger family protein [Bacillota bacterium]